MNKIIKRINAPFVKGSGVCQLLDSVYNWISESRVGGVGVDLSSNTKLPLFILTQPHLLEQKQRLLYISIPTWTGDHILPAILHLLLCLIANICLILLNQLFGVNIKVFEVVRAIRYFSRIPKPVYIINHNLYIMGIDSLRITVIKTYQTLAIGCVLGTFKIRFYWFNMPKMKVTVGLRRKSEQYLIVTFFHSVRDFLGWILLDF